MLRAVSTSRPVANDVPVVRIVIPAWGTHANYVPAAVDSLLSQSGPTREIVVVDNCSDVPMPDLPPEVEIRRLPTRVTVGAARNAGLHDADTPWIMFWDADDLMLPGALARMADVLSARPDVVAVTMDSVRWTPESGAGERWPWPRSVMYRLSRRPRLFAAAARVYNAFTTTGPALMRTVEVRDAGGFEEDVDFFEDWALAASLTVRGRIAMLREIGRLYRVHEESLTLGHLGHPGAAGWLRTLRLRTRRDPRAPLWLKALEPVYAAHHAHRARRGRREDAGIGFYESALDDLAGQAAA